MLKDQLRGNAPEAAQGDTDFALAVGLSRRRGVDLRMRLSIPMIFALLSALGALDSVTTHYLKTILQALVAYV